MQAAAVLGTQVDPVLLAGLLEVSELVAVRRCEAMVPAALLERRDLGYEFAGDLVQEVVYAALADPLRRAHHRRAADLLAHEPEAMAPHAEAVADWARAARGWLLAGRSATVRAAARDAVALLDRALEAAERVPAPDIVVRVLLARAAARDALTEYPDALLDLDAALATARETGDRRLEMAALRARGGDVPVALHHPSESWGGFVRSGLRLAAELGDRTAEAELGARLSVLATSSLRFEEALDFAHRALAAGRASGDPAAVVAGLDGLKTVLAYLGDTAPLAVILDELTPLARRLGDGLVLQWCLFESSFVAFADGDADGARRRVDVAVAAAGRSATRRTRRSSWRTGAGWRGSAAISTSPSPTAGPRSRRPRPWTTRGGSRRPPVCTPRVCSRPTAPTPRLWWRAPGGTRCTATAPRHTSC